VRASCPVAFIAFLLATAPASADSIGIGKATVAYDPAIWHVVELSGVAGLRFDCVAPECAAGAAVYATASDDAPGDTLTIGPDQQPLTYAPPDGAIRFKAFTAWSGCRALDNPILGARGAADGVAYVFITALGDGCNQQPSPPPVRFLELLAGVKGG
jgi:hypothetical protein